jgi:hypothetical protein
MQALNSLGNTRRALFMAGVGMLLAFLLLAPLAAHAASTTVTVSTDKSYYAGTATVTVSGAVTPAPGVSGTNVAFSVVAPNGATVGAGQLAVGATTGAYSGTFVTGGTLYSVNGTYTVNVNYNGATASSTFQYGNVTTSGGSGTTTTVMVTTTVIVNSATTTTVISNVQTTVTQQTQTTITQQFSSGTTTTIMATTTVSQTGTDTGTIVGAVGVVIAIVAGALAIVALRKH